MTNSHFYCTVKMATVSQSGMGSSAGHRAKEASWFQWCVQSTSTTSTTEVWQQKKQYITQTQWLRPDTSPASLLQGEPTASVTHQGAGSRCPVSTAHGLTILNVPHTWLPTTGVWRRYVHVSNVHMYVFFPYNISPCVQLPWCPMCYCICTFWVFFFLLLLQKVFERLHLMYTVGYSISLASLLVAVSILCYFK